MPPLHIHDCQLDSQRHLLDASATSLPADEMARAARFKAEVARDEYLLSRLLLRRILTGYLGKAPGPFTYGAFGKPGLGDNDLEFNLSHSRGRLLVAVCHGIPVGVDVERIDSDIDPIALARTGLPLSDQADLLAAPEESRREVFYTMWTHREACLKALGTGLGRTPEILTQETLGHGVQRLELSDIALPVVVIDLPMAEGFRAAVALAGCHEAPEIVRHDAC